MKTTLHHTRIIMKHAGGLEGLLVAKRHAEHLAAEDGVDSTDDERDAGVAGTPTKSGAPQAPPRTPEKGARKPKNETPPTKKQKASSKKQR